ncbi:hypothetical protein RHODGE_RHODGE_02724 [Rhodoplanes serenus]|uniref:DUF1468 domain-containing protein n=1 Tax=Rhodoplanes serenus TaxID=200615 RepID=A0A3S4B1P7_9BRAD|nr:tripartite tricarboxylate transporter TctB family protein [Rhodoplanes serenus]MBI5110868.1 tripartite tricarboxylate transporter TctB family protein [Rhodovulum sp.]VCU09553.1 hypothetical protein RHODGE_RHODGE_02724 [Rhodoplanes serenus]
MASRFHAELATALGTAAFGAVVVAGAIEYGIGWDSAGPEPGAFPFYVGLLIILASLANGVQAIAHHRALATAGFLDGPHARRVLIFVALSVVFVILATLLGLYVAAVLYVAAAAWWQGGYRPWIGAACGIATALFFYVVLEKAFQVPLLKGPLEAALGIH